MVTKAKAPVGAESAEIQILELQQGQIDMCILGTSPLIMNRMSQKVWFELLAPKGKKSTSEKASSMKHDPMREFRDSPYIMSDPKSDTLFGVMASGFKKAMGTAALRIPGVRKTEIGQLVYVPGEFIEIFGLPQIFMSITRSADINKTPDVRTRSILPKWACRISVTFIKPALREQSIWNLMAAAGLISGLGDWRQEKGSGSFGSFRVCSPDDPEFVRITKTMGRTAQLKAYNDPPSYNAETSEMLAWFEPEMKKRGFAVTGRNGELEQPPVERSVLEANAAAAKKPTKRKTNGAAQLNA